MKKFFKFGCLGFVALIVLGIIVSALSSGDDSGEKATSDPKTEETAKGESKTKEKSADKEGVLTEEKFEKIKDGMTYEEVVEIVGSEGSLMSETGEKGTDFHTVMYEFDTDGFLSNATMTFQGGKLMNKAQFGMGGSDVEISLEQFNQIENGMTLEEVIEIVGGEGEIVSETGEEGTDLHTVMYSYSGEGGLGANVSLMFQGNKLQNKTQVGLE
jgi:outer membrane protein assembly factor BamE (lipoprotein component of BamABCDE complex)